MITNFSSKKYLILLLTGLIVYFISCKPENNNDTYYFATVVWSGDIQVDGCGWLINMQDSTYKPTNLPSEYQIDNLEVSMIYKLLETSFYCDSHAKDFKNIEVLSIRNRDE